MYQQHYWFLRLPPTPCANLHLHHFLPFLLLHHHHLQRFVAHCQLLLLWQETMNTQTQNLMILYLNLKHNLHLR